MSNVLQAGEKFLGRGNNRIWVDIPNEGRLEFQTKTRIGAPWTVFFTLVGRKQNFQEIEIDFGKNGIFKYYISVIYTSAIDNPPPILF